MDTLRILRFSPFTRWDSSLPLSMLENYVWSSEIRQHSFIRLPCKLLLNSSSLLRVRSCSSFSAPQQQQHFCASSKHEVEAPQMNLFAARDQQCSRPAVPPPPQRMIPVLGLRGHCPFRARRNQQGTYYVFSWSRLRYLRSVDLGMRFHLTYRTSIFRGDEHEYSVVRRTSRISAFTRCAVGKARV